MENSNISTLDASNWTYEFEKSHISKVEDKTILSTTQKNAEGILPTHLEYLNSTYDNKTGTSGTAFLDKNTGEVIIAYTGTNKDGNAVQDIIGADNGGIGMVFGIPSITVVIMLK
ncbi:hypothetical protein HO422_10795 [Streptococcus suis]|nr:hypothetical protein [Streptococcus suis]